MSAEDRPRSPYVACMSRGGIYSDESYAAGYEAATFERCLSLAVAIGADVVKPEPTARADNMIQIEAMAANYGYEVTNHMTDDEGYRVSFEFVRVS